MNRQQIENVLLVVALTSAISALLLGQGHTAFATIMCFATALACLGIYLLPEHED
jgi:hypothetical protein